MVTQSGTAHTSAVAVLDSARQELLLSFQGLTEEQMAASLPDGWSAKDILAHVAMWEEQALPDMRRAARGDRAALDAWDHPIIDEWNHVQFVLREGFSLEQVLRELRETRRAIVDFLGSARDEQLLTGYIPMACIHSTRHDQRHAEQIRAWRQQQGV